MVFWPEILLGFFFPFLSVLLQAGLKASLMQNNAFNCNFTYEFGLWFCLPVQDYLLLLYSFASAGCVQLCHCTSISQLPFSWYPINFARFPCSLTPQAYHPLCLFSAWHLSWFPPPSLCICSLSSKCTPSNPHSIKTHKFHLQPFTNCLFLTSNPSLLELGWIKMFCGW